MQCQELILGNVTNPGGTLATPGSVTAATGQSFTIRSFDDSTHSDGSFNRCHLITAWGYVQTAGSLNVRSPRMHDNTFGQRSVFPATTPAPVFPFGNGGGQALYSQDTLVVTLTGGGSGKIEEALLHVYYDNLPGGGARLTTPADVKNRGVNEVGILATITAGSAGGWSGGQALNLTDNRLKAGVDYAFVGATFLVSCAALGMYGIDTGNLIVGVPGWSTNPKATANYLSDASLNYGLGLIPIINGSNQASTTVQVAQNDGGAAVSAVLNFVELAPVTQS